MASGDKSQTTGRLAEGFGSLCWDRAGWPPSQNLSFPRTRSQGGRQTGAPLGTVGGHPAGLGLFLCGLCWGFLGLPATYMVLMQEKGLQGGEFALNN